MKVLDLFSGIGGFSLGLERTGGFETAAFCEIDPFCRRVLAKHWPEVPCYEDVRELTGARLAADGIAVDVICGGFPCQDVSFAGKRAGLEGARSGLWGEYRRVIGEVRPRYIIVENVPGLLSLGMGTVLGDLSALGFDAVWDCVPASAVGAPHRRDRVWLVAHAISDELREQSGRGNGARRPGSALVAEHGEQMSLANSNVCGLEARRGDSRRQDGPRISYRNNTERCDRSEWWSSEPDVGRVANGVPSRVDRLRSLGNSVVPQVVTLIGAAIIAARAEGRMPVATTTEVSRP
jgi:DNA (cytosine-5)-methyltransferase 1